MKSDALLVSVASVLILVGCQGMGGSTKSGGNPPPRERAATKPQKPRTTSEPARNAEIEQRLARTELRLLEKEAQVEELQARLDDARREVVRSLYGDRKSVV